MLHDPPLAVDDRGELRQLVDGVVMGGRLDRPLEHRAGPLVGVREDPGGIHPRVVDVDRRHGRIAGHPLAIGAHRAVDHVPGIVADHPDLAAGDDEARRQALEVELERPGEGLVEVVDVEEQVAFRRCEQPEVRQVRIAAELDGDVRPRSGRRGPMPSAVPRRDRT